MREDVVGTVLEAAIAERGAVFVAFRRVVEDHIEDDLDARRVHGLDHRAEVIDRGERRVRGGIAAKGREEGNRRIAPVIRFGAEGLVLRIELLDGQEFDCCDAQILQIGDFLDQPLIRAAQFGRDAGTRMLGEAADVQFVDHGAGVGRVERLIVLPIVGGGIDDDGFHGRGAVVLAETGRRPAIIGLVLNDGLRIRVDQHLAAIEAQADLRLEASMHPVSVDLSRFDAGEEHMPVVEGLVVHRIEGDDLGRRIVLAFVEEQQIDRVAVF